MTPTPQLEQNDRIPLLCATCREPPIVAQDEQGLWEVIHVSNWFACGTQMAMNWPSRNEAIDAWNSMIVRRSK